LFTSSQLEPVFILSAPRSGSTLLCRTLGCHPSIFAANEIGLGRLCHDLMRTAQVLGSDDRESADTTRRHLGTLMATHTRRNGKQMWCEKTPGNVFYREHIARVFPRARYVCLYRHCRDVVFSRLESHRAFHKDGNRTVETFAREWVEHTEQCLAAATSELSRCMALKYELLATHPTIALSQLESFLAIAPWPEWLDRLFGDRETWNTGPLGGDTKIRYSHTIESSSIGRGRDLDFSECSPDVRERVDRALTLLGYPSLAEPWHSATSPSNARRLWGVGPTSVDDFFRHVLPTLSAAHPLPTAWQATLVFRVGDPLAWREYCVSAGESISACTCTIADDVLLSVLRGTANPMTIFLRGELGVDGDSRVALSFFDWLWQAQAHLARHPTAPTVGDGQ